jgi:uncharacterized Zn-binding protein involved in type VI secretion
MPPAGRLGDQSMCPHGSTSPSITGSPDVKVNGQPALRVTDKGVPPPCCPMPWVAVKGSGTVFINGLPAHRLGDQDQHASGPGKLIEGSPDVNIGG